MKEHIIFRMGRQNYKEVSSYKTYHRLNMIKKSMRLFLKLDKIIPVLFWKNKQVTGTNKILKGAGLGELYILELKQNTLKRAEKQMMNHRF